MDLTDEEMERNFGITNIAFIPYTVKYRLDS